MASTTTDLRLFGLDLRALWAQLCAPWRGRSGAALTAWLTPSVVIRLLRRDAEPSYWLSAPTLRQAKNSARSARFDAIEIPEAIVLRRELSLPQLTEDQTADAVALEAKAVSPFAPDDMVWGYRTCVGRDERKVVELVLASRKQIVRTVEAQSAMLKPGRSAEAWVMTGEASPEPIVIGGFGELQRLRHLRHLRRICIGLLALTMVMCIAIAVTPTAQLWLRGKEAASQMEQLKRRVAPVVSEREAFILSINRLGTLSDVLSARIDPLRVMDIVTKVLPDDTSVQIMQVQGAKVTINGLTASAAALMQQLSNQPGLHDVKAPTGASRPQGAQRENYVIEFTLVEPKPKPGSVAEGKSATQAATASVPATAASALPAASGVSIAPASVVSSAGSAVTAASAAPVANANMSKPASAPQLPSLSVVSGSKSVPQGTKP